MGLYRTAKLIYKSAHVASFLLPGGHIPMLHFISPCSPRASAPLVNKRRLAALADRLVQGRVQHYINITIINTAFDAYIDLTTTFLQAGWVDGASRQHPPPPAPQP